MVRWGIAAGVLLPAVLLSGCSEYLDRRDTIALSGGDALAADAATQMVDPWPAVSRDRNIPANGERMRAAVERYRTGKVKAPISPMTSSAGYKAESADAKP